MTNKNFLKIENISKSFGKIRVLENINLNISKSEFFGLLGSSGSGKTTLLRILGGFETPDSGRIYLDGLDITNLEPFERPLNYMFQSYALFPHLNVFNNLAFGIKDHFDKNEINNKVNEISKLLSIESLLDRRIKQLSGGEQQRVALGRCLIKKPKLLLLDEPLAALDKKLRVQTQFELVNLQYKLGITFIIVTHDQEEAMSLSDRMAIMKEGNILQIGNPVEIYEKHSDKYVANFIGTANLFNVNQIDQKLIIKELNLEISNNSSKNKKLCLIRPEKIKIQKLENQNTQNQCIGVIKEVAYLGSYTKYLIESNGFNFYAFMQN